MTLIKTIKDQLVLSSPMCGEIREIIRDKDYAPLGLAVAIDIKPTHAHYHETFDEIYFVLDGKMTVRLYDPVTNEISTYLLNPNELVVISKGVHHGIVKSSKRNRLCVVSVPPFHAGDEHASNKI